MQSQVGVDGNAEAGRGRGRECGNNVVVPSHLARKRRADESSLNDDDRFAKRLNRLSLETRGRHDVDRTAAANGCIDVPQINAPFRVVSESPMSVDETPHRVYIHDLDEELAEPEPPSEEKLIFLPDIERYFSKIPQQVLAGDTALSDHANQQLVLYSVPQSLPGDQGHENVRKAILEARHRAMEKAVEDARHEDMNRRYASPDEHESVVETAHGYGGDGYDFADSPHDVMDVD